MGGEGGPRKGRAELCILHLIMKSMVFVCALDLIPSCQQHQQFAPLLPVHSVPRQLAQPREHLRLWSAGLNSLAPVGIMPQTATPALAWPPPRWHHRPQTPTLAPCICPPPAPLRCKDPQLRTAFFFAMGNTVVATDLEQAARIGYSSARFKRVVTIKVGREGQGRPCGWVSVGAHATLSVWLRGEPATPVCVHARVVEPLPTVCVCMHGHVEPLPTLCVWEYRVSCHSVCARGCAG